MKKIIIVATDENNVIGKDNQLIWHLPADLKHFKNLTMGFPIIMGRKTFESIGKPLPGRTSVIITRNKDYQQEGAMVVNSLEEAFKQLDLNTEKCYIIGGGEIYNQAIEMADELEITKVHHQFEGDTFFPAIDENIWTIKSLEKHEKDEKNQYDFSFINYQKK
jgi:dihydrofolate reductase